MRVGLDATPLIGARTGIGRYVASLLPELDALAAAPDSGLEAVVATAFTLRGRGELGVHLPTGVVDRSRPVPARLLQEVWARAEWPSVTALIGRVDVFHGTNFVLPPPGRARGVVTVHDLAFLHSPGTVSAASRRLRDLVPRALARAAVVCTPTRVVAGEVADAYGLADDRIAVTPLGIDPAWAAAEPPDAGWLAERGLPPRYVLFVGTLEPRKMLPTLLAAKREMLGGAAGDVPLVLVGPAGWGPALDLAGLPENQVVTAGYLADDEVRRIVAGAAVLAFPSSAEGFGLPPLEAFAAGVPVVASDLPVLREVLGDDPRRATFVPVGDAAPLARALTARLVEPDPPGAAGDRRAWAARYTWRATAESTLEAYRRAAR
jgi:glycosyltransferase involved in cell wall biosynthesis